MDLGLEFGEEGVKIAKGSGRVEGEEGSNLGEFDVEWGIEEGEDSLVLGGGVMGWKWGDFNVGEEERSRVAEHLIVERRKRFRKVGDCGWVHLFRERKRR